MHNVNITLDCYQIIHDPFNIFHGIINVILLQNLNVKLKLGHFMFELSSMSGHHETESLSFETP